MALFVASANSGPSIGSPVGEWIAENPNMGLPWVFWINVIIGAAFALGMCFLPETLPRTVIARAVKNQRSANPEEVAIAEEKIDVLREMRFVTTMALKIMVTEPIVLFLGLYNGFAYGLLFLYLDGVFDVFVDNNGLSYIGADLTYLNFIVGVGALPARSRHRLTLDCLVAGGASAIVRSLLMRVIGNHHVLHRAPADLPLQERQAQSRHQPSRSSLSHLSCRRLGLPHFATVVCFH